MDGGTGNTLYRHRYIGMGVISHSIISEKCIYIRTYRHIFNISTFDISVITLSFT